MRSLKRWLVVVAVFVALAVTARQARAQTIQQCGQTIAPQDIICNFGQLIQSYGAQVEAWAQLQFYGGVDEMLWKFSLAVCGVEFGVIKFLIGAALLMGRLSTWLSGSFFQPLIQANSGMFNYVTQWFFAVALGILGLTYLIASIIRLQVVSLRNVLIWYFVGVLVMQYGPSMFVSLSDFRSKLEGFFYASGYTEIQKQTSSGNNPFKDIATADLQSTAVLGKLGTLSNSFEAIVPSTGPAYNGMDITLAYLDSDGCDVMKGGSQVNPLVGYGNTGVGDGCAALPIPRWWLAADSGMYFDQDKEPVVIEMAALANQNDPVAVNKAIQEMQDSVWIASYGVARLFNSVPMGMTAVIEQLVDLLLMVAEGIVFVQLMAAILFGFFRRTEPVAYAMVDQIISLLIQTVVVAMSLGLLMGLYIAAAESLSPLVTLGMCMVGFVVSAILVVSAARAIWSAFNSFFNAVGRATGGNIISAGAGLELAAGAAAAAVGAAATGGASLLGAAAAGAGGWMAGGSPMQVAGAALNSSAALEGVARTLVRVPGMQGTRLGTGAAEFLEGMGVAQVGRDVGSSMLGPAGGVVGAGLMTSRPGLLSEVREAGLDDAYRINEERAKARKRRLALNVPGDADGAESMYDTAVDRRGEPIEGSARPAGPRRTPGPLGALVAEGTITAIGRGDVNGDFAMGQIRPVGPAPSGAEVGQVTRAAVQDAEASEHDEHLAERDEESNRIVAGVEQAERADRDEVGNRLAGLLVGRDKDGSPVQGVRVEVSGVDNLAMVLGATVAQIQSNRVSAGGPSGPTSGQEVGMAMGRVLGLRAPFSEQTLDGQIRDAQPIEGRGLASTNNFVNSAVRLGLSGEQAEAVVSQVKASPEGTISPELRSRLERQLVESRSLDVAGARSGLQDLESAAASVPTTVAVKGWMGQADVAAGPQVAPSSPATVSGSTRVPQGSSYVPPPRVAIQPLRQNDQAAVLGSESAAAGPQDIDTSVRSEGA